jgi:hypothetical protein
MKTLKMILQGGMLSLCVVACAQNGAKDVPAAVKKAFESKFSEAKKVEWEKEKDSEWEAEFEQNGIEYSANFLADGTWVETEHEIKKEEIPVAVLAKLQLDFEGYKYDEVELSETPNGKFYEMELEKGKEEIEVTFSEEGKLISKKEENGYED